MPVKKLKEFLDSHKIKYLSIKHSPAYTAQEIAAKSHISGKELAKTVVIRINNKVALAVLPASYKIDFEALTEVTGSENVSLAGEEEFKYMFPDCEIGAMPPFGNQYNLDVYVAQTLLEDDEIAFNAGTHSEFIRMSYKDFEKLVSPRVLKFSLA
jgi:Ala-tRNA(Pro) deacylase